MGTDPAGVHAVGGPGTTRRVARSWSVGRPWHKSSRAAIVTATTEALARDCSRAVNPYGDGHSAERIVAKVKRSFEPRELLKKRLHMFGD